MRIFHDVWNQIRLMEKSRRNGWWRRPAALAATALGAALGACGGGSGDRSGNPPPQSAPKVMIINMFSGEAGPFQTSLKLNQKYSIRGLSAKYPDVLCNDDGVCQITTDMGYANAAASITALLYSGPFDLKKTYFIVAGIAGINPRQGTLGSAAWAKYLVDYSLSHEIDTREVPANWPYGYFGISSASPTQKPTFDYRTEVFNLNETLVDRAFALSKNVALSDSAEAQAFRAHYADGPASRPPTVLQCDTSSGDTWFSGTALSRRAEDWSTLLTDGKAQYCTTQQEDNSTLEALRRGDAAGKVNLQRVLVLRSGSDMDSPYPGQSSRDALVNYGAQGGYFPATNNLVLTATPVIQNIVSRWSEWAQGVPATQ